MEKMTYTLFNSLEGYDYQDYLDYCYDMELKPQPEGSDAYYSWLNDMEEMDWEDFQMNLKYSDKYPVLIEGTVGLWYGGRDVYPVRCETVYDAVMKCIGECSYLKVEIVDGVIEMSCYHHDGCNCFTIKKLTQDGIDNLHNCYDGYIDEDVFETDTTAFDGYIF